MDFVSGQSIATFLFLIVVVAVAVTSGILFFHWKKYGMRGATLAFMEVVYLAGVVVLLGTSFFALG